MFRGGPAHTGVYQAAGLPAFGGLQWRVQTGGPVRSTPTVVNGTVYVGSSDGHVYAIGARTGDVRWRHAVGSAVTSTPAVAGGLVYVTGSDRTARALRAVDGRVVWSFRGGSDVPLQWGLESGQLYTSSPVVARGIVVFGSTDGHLYALDARTGRERWRFRAGARIYSSPAVDGRVVVVGAQNGIVYAVDLGNGRERWRFEAEGARLRSENFGFDRTTVQSSPAVVGGAVYVGARDGFLYALDRETGRERWRFDHKVSWVNSSPAVSDGLVYAGSSDGQFIQAVDTASGEERWRVKVSSIVWTSAAVDAERVYIGEANGNIYALNKRTGAELWRYRGGYRLFSSPVVHDDRLFIGNDDGSIYALNAGQGASLRRAVFWDSAYVRAPLAGNHEALRTYLVQRGYELLDAAGLARFLGERLADRAPSVVVFAIDHLPKSVAPTADDTVLFRRYLDAGGTVIWLGAPPLLAPMGITSLKELDRAAPARLLGIRFTRGNFDMLAVPRVTSAGRRLGLPEWYLDNWSADPADVTTVLATDEHGQAAAWIKSYGGPSGTGFIRLISGDGAPGRPIGELAVQTAAEFRPR